MTDTLNYPFNDGYIKSIENKFRRILLKKALSRSGLSIFKNGYYYLKLSLLIITECTPKWNDLGEWRELRKTGMYPFGNLRYYLGRLSPEMHGELKNLLQCMSINFEWKDEDLLKYHEHSYALVDDASRSTWLGEKNYFLAFLEKAKRGDLCPISHGQLMRWNNILKSIIYIYQRNHVYQQIPIYFCNTCNSNG
jgi:hypothetical protein